MLRSLFIIVAILASCKKPAPRVADAKFIPLPLNNYNYKGKKYDFLINKVHASELKVAYGFAITDDKDYGILTNKMNKEIGCSNEKKSKLIRASLEEAISNALDLWLHPLRQLDKKIVARKNYVFTYLQAKAYKMFQQELKDVDDEQHLEIIFYCHDTPGSFALASTRNWKNNKLIRPAIHMYGSLFSRDFIPNTRYDKRTLLHEIGHAFGLDDTHRGIAWSLKFHQPVSIMSSSRFHDEHQNIILTEDDIRGIIWLYRYYTRSPKIKKRRMGRGVYKYHAHFDTCLFSDYELVTIESEKYCIPKNFYLSEVKQAHLHELHANFYTAYNTVSNLTLNIPTYVHNLATSAKINAQDDLGNTISHYAIANGAMSKEIAQEWQQKYSWLPEKWSKETALERHQREYSQRLPREWLKLVEELFKLPKCSRKDTLCLETDTQNNVGHTPLHLATKLEYMEALKIILRSPPADVALRDAEGKSACDYASEKVRAAFPKICPEH